MKKLFKTSTLFAILAAGSLLAVSCDTKTPQGEPPAPPTLLLGVGLSQKANTETSVTVKVSLQKDAEGYNYAIGQAGDLAAFTDGTLEDIKTQNDISQKEVIFDGLTENTEYTVFAQAFAGKEKGKVQTLDVKTKETEREPDLNITAALDSPTETSMLIKVNYVAGDVETLVYGVGTPEDREAFEKGTLSTIKEQAVTGSKNLIVSGLERGTEYTVFIQAKTGDKKGNVVTVEGRTYKLELELVLVDGSLTHNSAVIEMRPGGDTKRFRYALAPPEYLEIFETGQWVETTWVEDGTQVKVSTAKGLKPNTEYSILAQPFADNSASGKSSILTFRTLPQPAEE